MPLTASSATSWRNVDRSKSTIQSSDSGKLRSIWDASTVEHSCSPRWARRHLVCHIARDPTTNDAFRIPYHKSFASFYKPPIARHGGSGKQWESPPATGSPASGSIRRKSAKLRRASPLPGGPRRVNIVPEATPLLVRPAEGVPKRRRTFTFHGASCLLERARPRIRTSPS